MRSALFHRTAAVVVTLALTSIALTACSSANPPQPGQLNPTNGTAAALSTADPGAGGGSAPTTSPPAPPSYPNSADAYAKAAVAALISHDNARLDQLEAPGGLIHTMASCAGCYNMAFAFVQCEGAMGSSYCLFFNAVGDELTVRLQNPLVGGPQAIGTGSTFAPITFPSDDQAYALEALNAWLNHNDARLKLLTQANMTSAQVDSLGANRTLAWDFDRSDGAMGSIYFDWHDPSGHILAFRFLNGPPAPTTGAASHHRITEIVYLLS